MTNWQPADLQITTSRTDGSDRPFVRVSECVRTKDPMETAFTIARPGAIVGRLRVREDVQIDTASTFYRNVGMGRGPAPAPAYQPELLNAVLDDQINPGKVFGLTVDLDHVGGLRGDG
jgi:alcohol dehydrogenase